MIGRTYVVHRGICKGNFEGQAGKCLSVRISSDLETVLCLEFDFGYGPPLRREFSREQVTEQRPGKPELADGPMF